jgi:hypothetical protein
MALVNEKRGVFTAHSFSHGMLSLLILDVLKVGLDKKN